MARTQSRSPADGKVDVQCPQCATKYRILPDTLDDKIECADCHRVFLPRKTFGRRVARPDYTKAYVGFGAATVAIVVLLVATSGGSDKPAAPTKPAAKAPAYTVSNHPRAQMLLKWAQAVGENNGLVMRTHADLASLAKDFGKPGAAPDDVVELLRTHELSRPLRDLRATSAVLASPADMDGPTGKGLVQVAARFADANYDADAGGELEVSFRMDGEQLRVTSFWTKVAPKRRPGAK